MSVYIYQTTQCYSPEDCALRPIFKTLKKKKKKKKKKIKALQIFPSAASISNALGTDTRGLATCDRGVCKYYTHFIFPFTVIVLPVLLIDTSFSCTQGRRRVCHSQFERPRVALAVTTGWATWEYGFDSQMGRPLHSDRLWDPASLCNGCQGLFLGLYRPERDANHSPSTTAEDSANEYLILTFQITHTN
jgi:hypothetical protein